MVEVRIKAVAGLMFLAFVGLLLRAFDLQALRADDFEQELRGRKSHTIIVHPQRGRILDRNGKVLAHDKRSFDLYVELDEFEKNPRSLENLCRLLRITEADLMPTLEKHYCEVNRLAERADPKFHARALRNEKRYPRLLMRGISDEAAFEIELHEELYEGFQVRETLKRVYPFGAVGAHVLGYVGIVSGEEYQKLFDAGYFSANLEEYLGSAGMSRLSRTGEFMQEAVGRMGVEKSFDKDLRGACGLMVVERNLETRAKTYIELLPTQNGEDVTLSIDIELQKQVEEILAASEYPHEVAVVTDCETGGVLAMASKPSFDPNAFVPPINAALLRSYFDDKDNLPLMNRAIAGAYQLGSIFKSVTSYAALENGVITPGTLIECRGKAFEKGNGFRCHLFKEKGLTHGPIPLADALEVSCNCYFYELGKKLTLQQVEAAALRFGLGKPTELGLPGERRGTLPSYAKPKHWSMPDTMSLCIGQSILLVTPVQIAQMMTIIANRGRQVPLSIAAPKDSSGQAAEASYTQAIEEGLRRVVSGANGTAKSSGLARFNAAGKTSSAETVNELESHAWFGGYAPADHPKVAFVVLVEHGGLGGHAAAPVAAKILEKIFK